MTNIIFVKDNNVFMFKIQYFYKSQRLFFLNIIFFMFKII